MKAYIFPGQGSQFCGMGQDIYIASDKAKEMFSISEEILGFPITEIMFGEDADLLKQTKVTQPAIFIHSVILSMVIKEKFKPDVVAGHSLGEFSALVSAGYISFEDGLNLVSKRAKAMQEACERNPSKMAAVIGLENKVVEDICNNIEHIVVPANYNCPQQLVISGTEKGIEDACKRLIEVGARRAIVLPVGGAFHSPLMEPARIKLEKIGPFLIENVSFFGLYIWVPIKSAGNKSGVNCILLNLASTTFARVVIDNVLAKPGTPSSNI